MSAELLTAAYRDFNARRIEPCWHGCIRTLNGRTEWRAATSLDGRRFAHTGLANGARSTRMSTLCALKPDEKGRLIVEVHQVVRDLDGNVLIDTIVHHAYRFATVSSTEWTLNRRTCQSRRFTGNSDL